MDLKLNREVVLNTGLKRTATGLQLNIQCHPRLEEHMRLVSQDVEPRLAVDFGRFWISPNDLYVYPIPDDMKGNKVIGTGRTYYCLDRPGQGLDIYDSGARGAVINLSFLRIVGLSEGVTFTVGSVYSREGIHDLAKRIEEGIKQFHTQYLKPLNLNVMMLTTQEF